jgi:hypothetical protein
VLAYGLLQLGAVVTPRLDVGEPELVAAGARGSTREGRLPANVVGRARRGWARRREEHVTHATPIVSLASGAWQS